MAVELAQRANRRERAGLFEAGRAVWESFYGNASAARESAARALELGKDGREVQYAAAFALALAADLPRTRALADALHREFPEDTFVQFMYLPTLRALDGGNFVMYLGTFSKILSPGLRIGWLEAPGPVLSKINLGKHAADLCSSSMTSYLVSTYFAQANWLDYVGTMTEVYRGRRDTMLAALERHFPGEASWTHPQGGLFIWATTTR